MLDGVLDDAAWSHATKIDRFYEYVSSDGGEPPVRTTGYVTYDRRFLYFGIDCADPDPSKIRAAYTERDRVHGDQDFVAVLLDTTNEGRIAIQLRVNPHGVQGDAVNNDASRTEDFAPDFFYDAVARIHETGWSAEIRVPLASLRYPQAEAQTWRMMLVRNYPRAYRYVMASSRIRRGVNCYVCNAEELSGLRNLPDAGNLTLAPYATTEMRQRDIGDEEGAEAGMDVKWTPNAHTAIDVTINPDFSQVEADVPQIAVNERFAVFYAEKRPFFLEGSDLLDTPISAVHTRRITSPNGGVRVTGRAGSTSYTMLAAHDRGGGQLILPGSMSSQYANDEEPATAAIARVRHDIGQSFLGFTGTMRDGSGGHNRVFGPDLQWRPTRSDRVLAQLLLSDTDDRFGKGRSHAARLLWQRQTPRSEWNVDYHDYGDGFRADLGFVPQVGFRELAAAAAYEAYPEKNFFTRVRTQLKVARSEDRRGNLLVQSVVPGLFARGRFNSTFNFNLYAKQRVLVDTRVLERIFLELAVQFNPRRSIPAVGLSGTVGDMIDFANARVGKGANLTATVVLRPTDHLMLENYATRQYVQLAEGRIFTADVLRLKATYSFTAKSIVKVIGQRYHLDRNPKLYGANLPRQSGDALLSFLYSYKLNWQTVFFAGYGDTQVLSEEEGRNGYISTDRAFFAKISYAFQR